MLLLLALGAPMLALLPIGGQDPDGETDWPAVVKKATAARRYMLRVAAARKLATGGAAAVPAVDAFIAKNGMNELPAAVVDMIAKQKTTDDAVVEQLLGWATARDFYWRPAAMLGLARRAPLLPERRDRLVELFLAHRDDPAWRVAANARVGLHLLNGESGNLDTSPRPDDDPRLPAEVAGLLLLEGQTPDLQPLVDALADERTFLEIPWGQQMAQGANQAIRRALGDKHPGAMADKIEAITAVRTALTEVYGQQLTQPQLREDPDIEFVGGIESLSCRNGDLYLQWTAAGRIFTGVDARDSVQLPARPVGRRRCVPARRRRDHGQGRAPDGFRRLRRGRRGRRGPPAHLADGQGARAPPAGRREGRPGGAGAHPVGRPRRAPHLALAPGPPRRRAGLRGRRRGRHHQRGHPRQPDRALGHEPGRSLQARARRLVELTAHRFARCVRTAAPESRSPPQHAGAERLFAFRRVPAVPRDIPPRAGGHLAGPTTMNELMSCLIALPVALPALRWDETGARAGEPHATSTPVPTTEPVSDAPPGATPSISEDPPEIAPGMQVPRPLLATDYAGAARGEIVALGVDGGAPVNLTRNPRSTDNFPAWSPDGQRIAFNSHRTGGWSIWVMNADGSEPERLVGGRHRALNPAWSPDGEHVAFFGDFGGYWNIATVRADGSELRQLTDARAIHRDPVFSRDGKTILFYSSRAGGVFDLWTVRPDGEGLANLTRTPDVHELAPAWSPDGKRIACYEVPDRVEVLVGSIVVMDADASNRRRVAAVQGAPGVDYRDARLTWTPDGSALVFASYGTSRSGQLLRVPADGSAPAESLGTPDGLRDPCWIVAASEVAR